MNANTIRRKNAPRWRNEKLGGEGLLSLGWLHGQILFEAEAPLEADHRLVHGELSMRRAVQLELGDGALPDGADLGNGVVSGSTSSRVLRVVSHMQVRTGSASHICNECNPCMQFQSELLENEANVDPIISHP